MLAHVASSCRQGLRNAVAGPSRLGAVSLSSTSQPMAVASLSAPTPFLTSRTFHASTMADACHGRKKLKTHQGAAKRFRPAALKRVAVDHKSHPGRRIPLMMQALAIRQRNERQEAESAALGAPSNDATSASAAPEQNLDDIGLAASAGMASGLGLVPKTPADRKALRAIEEGSIPMRVIGHAWKSGHMGKQHLNSKMKSHRRTRLRKTKVWNSGPVNKTLQRLIGTHY